MSEMALTTVPPMLNFSSNPAVNPAIITPINIHLYYFKISTFLTSPTPIPSINN